MLAFLNSWEARMPNHHIAAQHLQRDTLYAAFDPTVHHVTGMVAESRFSARLAPFRNEEVAKSALARVGCVGGPT